MYIDPSEVPFCSLISEAFEQFARRHGLESECLYHDDARWIVTEPEPQVGESRMVQIAADRADARFYLCFMPNKHLWNVPKLLRGDLIQIPQSMIIRQELGSKQFDRQTFDANLQRAWQTSATIVLSPDGPGFRWTQISPLLQKSR